MWAIEHFGVEPDILLSAKGIASGLPLAAVVARAEILEAWTKGAHGSTFGGNPVACAAAITTIELLQSGLIENAIERGQQGRRALREIQADNPEVVVDSRGIGLMLAVEMATPELAEALEYEAFTRGLLVLGCGHKSIRLSPPLVIDEATMASGLGVLEDAIASVARIR
jgi:4-aminobutyrate aminotransferase